MQPSVGLDSVMAPNTTLTLRLCAVALLSNNVVRLHDSRFRHLLFIYAHLGTLERVDHFKETYDAHTQMLAVQSGSLVPTRHIDKHSQCHLAYAAIVPGHLQPQ